MEAVSVFGQTEMSMRSAREVVPSMCDRTKPARASISQQALSAAIEMRRRGILANGCRLHRVSVSKVGTLLLGVRRAVLAGLDRRSAGVA